MTGYVRIDTINNIADGNVINAADLDGEFNGVQAAFNSSTGHTHDGTASEGAPITKLGPSQNVTVSTTVLGVATTNTVDLGTSSLKFKDFYLAGNALIGGTLGVTSTATFTGAVIFNGNATIGDADTDTITQAASYVTGTQLKSAKTATNTLSLAAYDVDGTAYTNLITLTAGNTPTLALTSTGVGTINNMSIGATTASTGAFTTLSTTGNITNSNSAGRLDFTGASSAQVWATASSLYLDAATGQSVIIRPNNQVTAGTFSSTGLAVTGYITATNTSNITVATGGFDASTSWSLKVANASTTAGTGAGIYFLGGTNSESWIGNLYDSSGVGSLSFQTRVSGTRAERASISTTGVFTTVLGATIQGLTVGLGNASASATSTAVGISALASSTGNDATAFGYFAGENLTSGQYSVAIGSRAMGGATGGPNIGSYNTAIGNSALSKNTSGNRNIAIGNEALTANLTGECNVAIGSYQSAGGDAVLSVNTAGNNNTAVGAAALAKNTASNNTAIGYAAGYTNTSGNGHVFVGRLAGYSNLDGSSNVAIGNATLYTNSSGANNVAIGQQALQATTSSNNTAVGHQAGYTNSGGTANVYSGYQSGYWQTGSNNSAYGFGALSGASGSSGTNNTAVGYGSLTGSITATNNTAIGYQAGQAMSSGISNTVGGVQALYSNTISSENTVFGMQAGYTNVNGNGNTFVGYQAGYLSNYPTNGAMQNCFVGYSAGSAMTSGYKNTIIGSYSGNQGGLDISTANNNIVLSDGDGNHRFNYISAGKYWQIPYVGGTSTSRGGNTILSMNSGATTYDGSFQITDAVANNVWWGLLNGNAYVMVNTLGVNLASGTTAWASASDSRLKNVTGTYLTALSDIAQIDVVKFTWKSDEKARPCVGVIAQSVQGVVPEAVDEFTENDEQYLSVRYTELIPLIIASIKELKAEVDSLKSQLNGA